MELIAYRNGEIAFAARDFRVTYPRAVANQLILSARMNDWETFSAIWKRKTEPERWAKIEADLSSTGPARVWKLKEAFARLATVESGQTAGPGEIARRIPDL